MDKLFVYVCFYVILLSPPLAKGDSRGLYLFVAKRQDLKLRSI